MKPQENKQNKSTGSLFPIKMSAKLILDTKSFYFGKEVACYYFATAYGKDGSLPLIY